MDGRSSRAILTFEQKQWAYQKWCEGNNLVQIAEALHCSDKTIRRAINGKPRIRPVLVYEED